MIITAIICLILILIGSHVLPGLHRTYKAFAAVNQVPGPKPHWIYGTMPELTNDFAGGLVKIASRFPRMFSLYYGIFHPVLAIVHPDAIKAVMKVKLSKDTAVSRYLADWTGNGILVSNGSLWARNRRLLTPAFHFDILKPYVGVTNTCVDILMDKWSQKVKNCKSFEVFDDISLMTFDVLLRCTCSADLQIQTSKERHEFLKATDENSAIIELRFLYFLLSFDFIFNLSPTGRKFFKNTNYCRKFAKDIIEQRKKQLESGNVDITGKKHLDFLDLMLQAKDTDGKGLTVNEIVAEVTTFMFAGHDTTASVISWTLYSLGKYPQYQEQVRQEVEEVLKENELTSNELSSLKFTGMCIKEAMRLHTTVSILGRRLCDDAEIDGYLFPAGTEVEIMTYCTHHHPEIWPEPWKYDPMRFLPENISKRDPYAFIPFASGSRNCIGQAFALHEIKVAIARIIKRFVVEVDDSYPLRHVIASVLHNDGGIWLRMKERSM